MSDNTQRHKEDYAHFTAKAAAKQLGVDVEVINGLAAQHRIRSFYLIGRTGARVWRVSKEDIQLLEEKMAKQ